MKAGRELDALVAEKVMGWRRGFTDGADINWPDYWTNEKGGASIPAYYSTHIADAWQVVEFCYDKLDGGGRWYFTLDSVVGGGWMARVWDEAESKALKDVYGESAPLAICLAALRAVGVEVAA